MLATNTSITFNPNSAVVYGNDPTLFSGDGSVGNPYTGHRAYIKGGVAGTHYHFPAGTYDLGTGNVGLAFNESEIIVTGEGAKTIFLYRGTGYAIAFDGRRIGTLTTTGAATGGTITLGVSVNGGAVQNAVVNYNATAAQVATAINALSSVSGAASATGGPLGTAPAIVSFTRAIGRTIITLVTNGMTGGSSPNLTIAVNLSDNSFQMNRVLARDFCIDGNTTAERGIFTDLVWGSKFDNIYFKNIAQTTTSAAGEFVNGVCCTYNHLEHNTFFYGSTVGHMAYNGFIFGALTNRDIAFPDSQSDVEITGFRVDSVRNYGIWLKSGFGKMTSGTFEICGGTACQVESACDDFFIDSVDLENGATQLGIYINAPRVHVKNVVSYSGLTVDTLGVGCLFEGGRWGSTGTVTVNATACQFIAVSGVTLSSIVGTQALATAVSDVLNNAHSLPNLTVKGASILPALIVQTTDTSASGSAMLRTVSNFSSTAQIWDAGQGDGSGNDWVLTNITGSGVFAIRIDKTTNAMTLIGSLTAPDFGVSASVKQTNGAADAVFTVNNTGTTGAAGARVVYKTARSGHAGEYWTGIGVTGFRNWTLWDNTGSRILFDADENGNVSVGCAAGKMGFYGAAGAVKPTVTGSRGANAALASALTALASLGILTDSST